MSPAATGAAPSTPKEYRIIGVLCGLGHHRLCVSSVKLGDGSVRQCTCPCGEHRG